MINEILKVGLIMILSPFLIASMPLPKEWRIPNDQETNQDWRNTDKNRHLVAKADFDGDGVQDDARLVVRTDGKVFALVVISSVLGDTVVLDEDKGTGFFDVMGISVAEQGKYRTACGKGYFDCEVGEPNEISLIMPAIDYFKDGSANSFFWWDERKRNFVRTWISD